MPYPRNHLYLTIHWVPGNELNEAGQTGIRFDTQAAATQTLVDACKAAVSTFWLSAGAAIPNDYLLKFIRLARIGTDGKYVPGSVAFDGTYTTPGTAGGGAVSPQPLQLACVSTLVTALPRGQASHGRMYLPPLAKVFSSDYRWDPSFVNARSTAVATMLTSLNAAIAGPAIVASKGTTRTPAGLVAAVTGVKTGGKPDVQRRRAKNHPELYGTTAAVS